MQISTARVTGTKNCRRCGGSGQFGMSEVTAREIMAQGGTIAGPGVCFRCGGTGQQPTGFEGNEVSVYVQRSSDRRTKEGGRRGQIDVIATITTKNTPRATRGHGCRAVGEIKVGVRVVGKMVDGTRFDLTIKAAGMTNRELLAFEEKSSKLWHKVHAGLGVSPHSLDGDEEAAVLRDLGVI
jgi:hypothetical protein